jgi:hypothetical protein
MWMTLVLWIGVLMQLTDPVSATLTASSEAPQLGEAVTLTIAVEAPRGTVVAFDVPPPANDSLRLTLVNAEVSDIDAERARYTQTAVVILLAPGDFSVGAAVQYTLPGESAGRRITLAPVQFSIPSLLDPADLTLRPLRPPLEVPYVPPLVIAGALMAVGALIVGGYRLRGRLRRLSPAVRQRWGARTEAGMAALAELNDLWRESRFTPAHYARIADTLRAYVSGRFEVAALELTTNETIDQLTERKIVMEYARRELFNILDSADLIKFAGDGAKLSEVAARETIKRAIAWVRHVESTVA